MSAKSIQKQTAMATSSFVLFLSFVVLVSTQGCSAQLEHNESALISTLQGISDSTAESLRLHRQNTDALTDLQALLSLPDMVAVLGQVIKDLRTQLEARNQTETILTHVIQDLKTQLEARSQTVEQLTAANKELTNKLADNAKQVQDLNSRPQESPRPAQDLDTTQTLNQTVEIPKEELYKDPECRQPQLQEIKDVVQQFSVHRNQSRLRADMESVLNSSSELYQQLQGVEYYDGFTYWVGYRGETQIAALLLCAGLPIDTADSDGNNLLYGATGGGQAQMVKMLLDHGAQVDARDIKQNTPLIRAAYSGRLEVVKVLVEAGASTTVRDQYGSTPLEAARFRSHTAVVEYLQQLPQ